MTRRAGPIGPMRRSACKAWPSSGSRSLITNRIILTPSLEVDLPLKDDAEIGVGAWGPTVEVGARLSYDLVDRTLSPYVGVHYERAFGATATMRKGDGEATDALFVVIGARMMF